MRLPKSCDKTFRHPEDDADSKCNRAVGHAGSCCELNMLREYCTHITERHGRCAQCGAPINADAFEGCVADGLVREIPDIMGGLK